MSLHSKKRWLISGISGRTVEVSEKKIRDFQGSFRRVLEELQGMSRFQEQFTEV